MYTIPIDNSPGKNIQEMHHIISPISQTQHQQACTKRRKCGSVLPSLALASRRKLNGLAWFGMVWHGLAWFDMVWHGLAWFGMVWHISLSQSCKAPKACQTRLGWLNVHQTACPLLKEFPACTWHDLTNLSGPELGIHWDGEYPSQFWMLLIH